MLLDLVNKLIDIFRNDKELREGYKNAREAIIEAMNSIDSERAQRIKDGRTESAQSTDSAKEGVKYAVQTDNKGGKYWEIDTEKDIFKGLKTKEEFRDAAFNFLIGNRDNKVVYEDKNGKKIKFIRVSAEEFTRSKESTQYYKNDPEIFNKKMRLIPSLKDLLLNYSVEWQSKDHKNHTRFGNGFMNYRGKVKIDDTMFNYVVRVGKTDSDNVFYDINMEVNYYLPHTQKSASDMTSIDDSVSQKSETVNTHSMQNGKKYAVSDSYSREIDKWYKSGKPDSESFVLGSTGDVLQGLGAIESDIYMNSDKINKILDKHKEITVAEIKKIPEILEDPVLILKSQNKDRGGKQNTRLIIFGSVKGQDGRPVLSVLDLRPVENNLTIDDMQKVSSVYTKDNNPVEFVKASDIVYADKKRTANLLKSIGFQTPIELHHSGYIGSISYIKRSVNIKGEKFSDVFDTTANTYSMQTGEKYAASDDSGAEKITVKDVQAVQSIGRKSVNDFTSEDIKKTENFARRYFKEMGAKSPFFRAWFGDWRANDTTKITVANQKGAARGKIKNRDTGWDIQVSGKVFNETKAHTFNKNVTATPFLDYINSIVENAVLLDSYAIPENKAKSPNSVMMHSLYAIADIGKGKELVKLYIEELNDVNVDGTMKRAYQLQNIENQQFGVQGSGKNLSPITQTADVDTVSQLFDLVKQKDKNFNPKTSSKVVNEDGTPKVVYHQTGPNFDMFDLERNTNSENDSETPKGI